MPTVDGQDARNKWPSYSEHSEQRPVPAVNIVTRSGATTQVPNKEKQSDEAWVRKTPEKIPAFDVGREK